MPRNKYPEETIKKILDTSLQLFLEKGFEQTTVLDIVDNLGGLTRGAFYHHFKSKDEVLKAIFEREWQEHDPFTEVKAAKVANGMERLKLVLTMGLAANKENERRMAVSIFAHSLLSNPRFLAEYIKELQSDSMKLADLMQEGMADGSIKQGNPKIIAELFMLLTNVWIMPNIFPCSQEEMFEKVDLIGEIFDSLGYDFLDEELGDTFASLASKLND